MTPATSSSRLVPNPIPQKPCIPPPRYDLDSLFHPMFDEYFNLPIVAISPVPVADAPRAVELADSPVSMSIDQDAPSTSIPSSQEHSLIISYGFEESQKMPHFHDDPLYESLHEDSTSQGSSSNVRTIHTPFESFGRWTKDHPISNVIVHYVDDGADVILLRITNISKSRGIFLNQSKYASEIIKKYGLLTSDSVDTPVVENSKLDEDLQGKPVDATLYRGMIGSLMYLTSSRHVLIYAVCLCARYQAKPTKKHLNADTRRSTSGSAQFLGDKLVSWSSKKQKSIAISSTKAEFIALFGCCAQILWMRSQLTDYGAKHIDVRYHFINEQMENDIVELYFVRIEYQLADIFIKPLPRERFNFLIEKLGMRNMSPEMLKRLTEEEDK
ncbi:hypothetical protein Tco_1506209 [Tanacetum coccineum]